MKIVNPTENEVSVQYKGVVYTIPAFGTKTNVSEDVATYWQTMIHQFLEVSDDSKPEVAVEAHKQVEEVVELPEEEVETPVEEEVVKEVEAPAKPVTKSKK